MFFSKECADCGDDDKLITVTLKDRLKIGNIVFEPRACTFTKLIEPYVEKIAKFKVRDDDLFIASIPKSGTTWTQEMCWLLQNNFDFEKATKVDTGVRCPCLELSGIVSIPFDSVDQIANLDSPRCIQTHLPVSFLPREIWTKDTKVVYVFRDPRDVAVSMYEHIRNWIKITISKDEFFKFYINDKSPFLPYFSHVFEYWKIRNQPNVLFLTYDEMKINLKGVIQRTCKFLNKSITDEQLNKMLEYLSFKSMKNNKACNREQQRKLVSNINPDNSYQFIRRGIVGSYKDELSSEQIHAFNEWIQKNLKNTDFNLLRI